MPYFEAKDGTDLYYYDWGTGAPVVLIHGWPLSSASWEYQARVLADSGFRVIAYDRRGFGRSDWAAKGYDYDTFASDLNDLMEGLNLTGATVVGFSMGGGEVARYIGRYGESRLAKAVYISAVPPFMLKTDDNPDGVDKKVFDEIIEGLEKDRPDFLKSFAKKFYGNTALSHKVSEAQREFFHSMAMSASPKATIECVRAFGETDFRSDLSKATIPTLVIYGSKDETVPPSVAGERMKGLVANSESIEYDGEAHGLTNSAPDKLNHDLLTFMRAPARVAGL
ncbi:alpha/beta fold hydrolase [Terriglobus sp.]|uniref:alpha/beta fold hydrolase n=1 Tax=Terriglobus sp. TaxID=1889013 RepID=UPI003B006D71